jgi:hypothetical protein
LFVPSGANTGGCVTLAASRLLGPDAAPAPRLAIDKSTARPSAKRRRIQLPPIEESRFLVVCSFRQANVVVTGGHLEKAIDLLSFTTGHGTETETFKAERLRSNSTHGTGCAFATSLACHLAHGRGLPEAVLLAKVYVSAAIANAHPIGKGVGPLHHLYRMTQQRRASASMPEAEHAQSRN